jgi:hypothetical protein
VALILDYPFRTRPEEAPQGVVFREIAAKDRHICEFIGSDEHWLLVAVKFKPIPLIRLGDGPPNPTAAHIARMEEVARADEARGAARAEAMRGPGAHVKAPDPGGAAERFLGSMQITYEMWHDGVGYDLDALSKVPASARDAIETVLLGRQPPDWRDIEALAALDTPRARAAVEAALHSSDPSVRQEAMRHAGSKLDPKKRESLLIKSLEKSDLYGGLSEAIDEVEEFHPPAVIEALLRGALHRDGEAAVHFAAMLYYLHGKAEEPFDWNHRPFFLRFNATDRAERRAAFGELCGTIGVDPSKYLKP